MTSITQHAHYPYVKAMDSATSSVSAHARKVRCGRTHQSIPRVRVLVIQQRGVVRGPPAASQLPAQVVSLRRCGPERLRDSGRAVIAFQAQAWLMLTASSTDKTTAQ